MLHLPSMTTSEMTFSLLSELSQEINIFFQLFDISAFSLLVDRVYESRGSLIFTGVGKSGFIGKKIAATMTSSGSRSFFLSPQDALHGDLGSVYPGDTIFLMSKSGESDELIELIPYLKKKKVSCIGIISSKKNSRLEEACDEVFFLPDLKELCPFQLAPTTSTLIQLIFGDLLAMTLMRKKQVSQAHFIINHPGGRIGKRHLICVEDLMLKGDLIPICRKEALLTDILVDLSNKKCGCMCVIDGENRLVGIFTDGDLRRALQKFREKAFSYRLELLMTPSPKVIVQDALAYEAMGIMEEDPERLITSLPVINESSQVIGLIRMHDILQAGI